MGAWAEDSFGNDTAADWAGDFAASPGLEIVREAIAEVLDEEDYLESDVASNCVAACEVIARLQGNWGEESPYSEEIDTWVRANPMPVPADLRADALAALGRVRGPDSELQELWEEDGPNDVWRREMDDLRSRVAQG